MTLPDFHERLSGILGAERVLVGLLHQTHLLVTDADAASADTVRAAVLDGGHEVTEVVPSLLLVEPSGLTLLGEYR